MAIDDGTLKTKPVFEFDLTDLTVDAVRESVKSRYPEIRIDSRDYFKLYSEYTERFLRGEKHTTIRFEDGEIDLPIKNELPLLVNTQDNPEEINYIGDVTVNTITIKRFDDLTEEDALLDGFESRQDAITALKRIYPTVTSEDLVTIYSIEPSESISELQQRFRPSTE